MLMLRLTVRALGIIPFCLVYGRPDNPPKASFDSIRDGRFTNTSLVTYENTVGFAGYNASTVIYYASTETYVKTNTTSAETVNPVIIEAATITGTTYTGFLENSTVTATTISATTIPGTTIQETITGYTSFATFPGTTISKEPVTGFTDTFKSILPAYCPNPYNMSANGLFDGCDITWGDDQTGMVSLFFWPSSDSDFSCVVNNDTKEISILLPSSCPATTNKSISSGTRLPTATVNDGGPATAIVNGYTFTSPSIYLSVGAVMAIGITLTDVLLSFAPGELQTGSPRNAYKAFNPADFPCPPCEKFLSDNGYDYGPGELVTKYAPNIAPISSLISLVPQWGACNCIVDYRLGRDPPIALTAGRSLSPASITAAKDPQATISDPKTGATVLAGTAQSTTTKAVPSSTPIPDPAPSLDPSTGIVQQQTVTRSVNDPPNSVRSGQHTQIDPSTNQQASTSALESQKSALGSQASSDHQMLSPDSSTYTNTEQVTASNHGGQGNQQFSAADLGSQQANTRTQDKTNGQVTSGATQKDPEIHQVTANSQGDEGNRQRTSSNQGGPVVASHSTTDIGAIGSQIAASLIGVFKPVSSNAENNPKPTMDSGSGPNSGSNIFGGQQSGAGNLQNSASQIPATYYIAGNDQTLAVAGDPITISGQVVSLAASGSSLVIDGSTVSVASYQRPATTVIASVGHTLTTTTGFQLLINGQTLTQAPKPFSAITALPHTTSAIFTVIPGQAQIFTIDNTPVTAYPQPTHFLVAGSTLIPGRPAITISGTPVSLASGASSIIIGTTTVPIPSPPLIIGSSTFSANSAGAFLIGSQTLSPGSSQVVIAGTTISLVSPLASAVIDGSTVALGTAPLTLGGLTITPTRGSGFVVGGTTITAGGPAVTVSGTLLSLQPTGSNGLGGLIMSAFSAPATESAQAFTGAGERNIARMFWCVLFVFGTTVSTLI